MIAKLAAYAEEMRFAWSAAVDTKTAVQLLGRTLSFHLSNFVSHFGLLGPPTIDPENAFELRLDLGFGPRSVWLRPRAGDLYILGRTFVQRYHDLPGTLLEPDEVRTVLDLGANIGMASLAFHARFPRARILAVEPLAANFELLRRNTAAIPAITPVRAAVVGEPRGRVRMTTAARAWGNRLAGCEGRAEEAEEVPARTIVELLDEHGIEQVDLLKIDIEGAEAEVFAEPSFLSRVGIVLVELHPPYDITALERDVAPAGFAVLPPDPKAGRAVPIVLRARGYVP